MRRALLDHLVIRIRDTDITDAEFEDFGGKFGTLKPSPDFTRSRPVYLQDAPNVTIISNVTEDRKPIGEHGDGELHRHTDLASTDEPAALTMLLAREVPPIGGNTSFANMYATLEALPEATRARIARLPCKHQASHNAQGGRRPGYKDIETDDVREMPGPIHPLVRTHPDTARQALFLGRRFGAYILALTLGKGARRCLTSRGPSRRCPSTPGPRNGAWATSSSWTIAAPCIGATPSPDRDGGGCTA